VNWKPWAYPLSDDGRFSAYAWPPAVADSKLKFAEKMFEPLDDQDTRQGCGHAIHARLHRWIALIQADPPMHPSTTSGEDSVIMAGNLLFSTKHDRREPCMKVTTLSGPMTASLLVFAIVGCGQREASTPAATAGGPDAAPAAAAPAADVIRGKGGLEEKCHERLAKEVGAPVVGTNRIEESEAAIAIYVNMQGAEAPWRCLGYKDGTIGEVMYTGSEGAQ
jgi:hypothetical protein